MNSEVYVLNHDFGYGREPELNNLLKLKLRDIEDVKIYVDNVLKNAFETYENFSFLQDNIEIEVEEFVVKND